MKYYKDEIQIMRGESFALDVDLVTPSGDPLIISNRFINPYYLLTISSTKYPVEDRVVRNYWCEVITGDDEDSSLKGTIPRFYRTSPFEVDSADITEVSTTVLEKKLKEWFPDKTLSDYVTHYDKSNVADFSTFLTIENGERKIWYFKRFFKTTDMIMYKPYEYRNRLVVQFTAEDTLQWNEEEYSFSMKLVDFSSTNYHPISSYDPEYDRPDSNTRYTYVQEILVPPLIKVHSNINNSLDRRE